MKKALVLGGGGTRGAYQVGAIRALRELGQDDWSIVCGTSVGALNGTLVVQNDDAAMADMWHGLKQEDIIKGALSTDLSLETIVNERNLIASFFKKYVKEKGADISPLAALAGRMFDPEKFFASPVDFGCVTVIAGTQKPCYVTKEMMRENGTDWLLASAAAFPAFPVYRIGETDYIDGGYFDNVPIDLALRMGAEEVIAVDLELAPKHPSFLERPMVKYIFPQAYTGTFLDFSRAVLDKRETLGYNDTMKCYGRYDGVKYTYLRHYPLPDWFDEWYLDLLKLETRIRIASNISDWIHKEAHVTDKLKSRQHRQVLGSRQMYHGMMDALLDLAGADVAKVYNAREAEDLVITAFAGPLSEGYAYLPALAVRDVLSYARTLDQKGIVEKIAHGLLYPDHTIFPENIRLTVYPFEEALARFLIFVMKGRGEREWNMRHSLNG